jgi:hypothetical protein
LMVDELDGQIIGLTQRSGAQSLGGSSSLKPMWKLRRS